MIEDHEEFPQLGTAPSNTEIVDSGWVNLPRSLASNMKTLRHCASSPDMRSARELPMLQEEVEDHGDDDDDFTEIEAGCSGDESFTLVSSEMASPTGTKVSFRDAILTKSSSINRLQENEDTDGSNQSSVRPRIRQAKFVVVPSMRRCIKSTGDLQSLSTDAFDSEVLGETDAMDYYHRKALGARGRASGLRMRPDEAKRKEITMYKKNLQRAGQL